MELHTRFEQAILKLAFETDARITPASVAYYLGIPSREATRMLNAMLDEGVLELDSDSAGNLFYMVPNQPVADDMGSLKSLVDARNGDAGERDGKTAPPPPPPIKPKFATVTVDDDDAEAFAPKAPATDAEVAPPSVPKISSSAAFGRPWGEVRSSVATVDADGIDGTTGSAKTRTGGKWMTVSTRVASPDASLDRCGGSSVVVATTSRCEPRPLPSAKPVIVSCSDSLVPTRAPEEQSWFGATSNSTALVEVGDTALAREYHIEQPEHQPGMALLLSLILCGTGQIYNGEVSKGIMMMVLCFLLWFVLLGWVVHIWSIVDAVVVAEKLNRRSAT